MSRPRTKQPPSRRPNRPAEAKPPDLWRPAPVLSEPMPVVRATDPTALLKSLGEPPLGSKGVVAGHYLSSVVERASVLATALAASAGLLAEPSNEAGGD